MHSNLRVVYITNCTCILQDHSEAKGLYGVPFPYYERLAAIYSKDIATGEGAEGFGEAIANLEEEIVAEDGDHEEDDQLSRETEKRSMATFGASSGKSLITCVLASLILLVTAFKSCQGYLVNQAIRGERETRGRARKQGQVILCLH